METEKQSRTKTVFVVTVRVSLQIIGVYETREEAEAAANPTWDWVNEATYHFKD